MSGLGGVVVLLAVYVWLVRLDAHLSARRPPPFRPPAHSVARQPPARPLAREEAAAMVAS